MRASDRAYESLREDILEWRLPPGAALGEVEQSTRLGVSRTPLREALARLVSDGLAMQQGGRGTVVAPVSLDNLDDLFEMRQALEMTAASAAARTVARTAGLQEPFADLATRLTRSANAGAQPAADAPASSSTYELAAELELAIDDAASNHYLSQGLRQLRGHLARVRRLSHDDPERLRAAALEHATIARAIAAGNPELAASATHVHLHNSLSSITLHAADRLRAGDERTSA
ncbi:GntR family transcriptional regulator [Zhihengliuella salsuginis]|uniref:GntR family transcriptional regulator n=1 Tax=Zhihengliuella salsuginis TaxID=578222 RepID=A0ABQ3GIK4_9MICC|nr:GntR family transcriptional regulator [Zhihengliuella salsuginis]GHD08929.1 GntR family transcriptional regulator [Zhihengliuella salsuginis]